MECITKPDVHGVTRHEHPVLCLSDWGRLFSRGGVDNRLDFSDFVVGKSPACGVVADRFLVGGDVHAVDLVVGDVAVDPLDLGAHFGQDAT